MTGAAAPTPPATSPADPAALLDTLARAGLGLHIAPGPTGGAPAGRTPGAPALLPHQQAAATRLLALLDRHGGALLADDVGLGKTYVALAVAARFRHVLVVAPAALRAMWRDLAARHARPLAVRSLEALGRPPAPGADAPPPAAHDLVVVDEAHHVRNPATRRWQRLAALAANARVLLLSATPVHNRPRDLTALLALFLGARAHAMSDDACARLVVRRRAAHVALPAGLARPRVRPTRWTTLPDAPDLLHAILALPAPVPPHDGSPAPALATLSLVRLWTSSDGALRAALGRRLARAAALELALAGGHHLDRRALRAWCPDAGVVQPALFLDDGPTDAPAPADRAALLAAVRAHAVALHALRARLDAAPSRDDGRVAWLRALRACHPDRRIVAFTQFADTARALWSRLAPAGRVALLTAAGGRIASGPIARRDLLARFAPGAAGLPPPVNGRNACAVQLRIA